MKRLMHMVLGKRNLKQDELFIRTDKLATSHGYPFHTKLYEVWAATGFDDFVKKLCA